MTSTKTIQTPFRSPEVRVVEASAGSGKTYALAKRYVQLLLNPKIKYEQIPIRNILAITFTNKASHEMKERIFEFLKNIAFKQITKAQEDDILKPLGLTKDQASKKAFTVMEGVNRHYNFFQVQTIDKFINSLLSGCAFKIGLTANFKIKTNSGEYLQYSLDQLIDRARSDKSIRKSFEQFLHHYLYLENRSGWFPKEDMLTIITALFEQSNIYGVDFILSNDTPEDVIKVKRKIIDEVRKLKEGMPEGAHSGLVKAVDKFVDKYDKVFDVDSLSEYFARDVLPVKKGSKTPKEAEKTWKKISTLLTRLCEMEARSLFNPYVDMYGKAIEGFKDQAAKDDCLFLNELNKKAGLLFDEDHITVEELYYRLATRFHHYLIDEFQDTSRLQWHNLEKMAEEALSTGGSLFYVGDRKQAIYGFRGGDVALFDDIKSQFKPFNVQVDLLTNNWRSQKAIVDFNTMVFSADNLDRLIGQKEEYETKRNKKTAVFFNHDDMAEIHNMFASAEQTHQPENIGGYVQMEFIDGDKKEDRYEITRDKMISLIRDLKKRFPYNDITILTRGNQEIIEVTQWLLEEDIPVESERTSDITESSIIQEIVAFLEFLNSPINNLAFTTFILSDLFSKATGLKKEELHHFVFSLRERLTNDKNCYVYTEFREKYPEIWSSYIEEFFRNVGLYPLYELVVTIYKRFQVLEHSRDDQGFLMHFLELIKKAEDEHADIQSFIEHFNDIKGEDLYVHISDSDAVKIMTIHKAKGLEFPVVILPFLGMDIQIGASSGEYQPSYIQQIDEDGMKLLRMKSKYTRFSDELKRIYDAEYKKSFLSELNSIYVALTRARNELYGFIPKRVGNGMNFAQFLFPKDEYVQGKQQLYKPKKAKDVVITDIAPPVYPDWIDYLKDEFLDIGEFRNRAQRLKGEVIHHALSFIMNASDDTLKRDMDHAIKQIKLSFPQMEDIKIYESQLKEILEAPQLREFFFCNDAEVFTEKDIVNAFGHTKRCDRLVIHPKEVWVIDYKSTEDAEAEYQKQVEEYKTILGEIYPDKNICGFLIYLDQFKVEKV